MKIAKVIGTIVSSRKDPAIDRLKIMMIQPLDENFKSAGDPIAAIDTVQAGPQELVYYTMARESSLALPVPFAPVDAAITGIIDEVNVENKSIHDKESIFVKEAK